MNSNPLVRLRRRLALHEAILGTAAFLLIAMAGTALYFAALLAWDHRLDEAAMAAALAALPVAAAIVAVAVLDHRQKAFLEAARGLVAGTRWITPDGLPFTAIDVRPDDLAIGHDMDGGTVFVPRELLRPLDGDRRAAMVSHSSEGDVRQRKAALARLADRHWKSGFAIGLGTVFLAVPALAALSRLAADPLALRMAIAVVFLSGCVYAIAAFSKAASLEEASRA